MRQLFETARRMDRDNHDETDGHGWGSLVLSRIQSHRGSAQEESRGRLNPSVAA